MLNVLLIDPMPICYYGVSSILKNEFRSEVSIDHVINLENIDSVLASKPYDLLIVEIDIPFVPISAMLSKVVSAHGARKVLVYTGCAESLYAKSMFRSGVSGFLSKSEQGGELVRAVRMICELGRIFYSEYVMQSMMAEHFNHDGSNPFLRLSQREVEVVAYMIKGKSLSEVSEMLNVHKSTVGTHKTRAFEKLGISTLFDLMRLGSVYEFDGGRGGGSASVLENPKVSGAALQSGKAA